VLAVLLIFIVFQYYFPSENAAFHFPENELPLFFPEQGIKCEMTLYRIDICISGTLPFSFIVLHLLNGQLILLKACLLEYIFNVAF
jgi:hypothetical protein